MICEHYSCVINKLGQFSGQIAKPQRSPRSSSRDALQSGLAAKPAVHSTPGATLPRMLVMPSADELGTVEIPVPEASIPVPSSARLAKSLFDLVVALTEVLTDVSVARPAATQPAATRPAATRPAAAASHLVASTLPDARC